MNGIVPPSASIFKPAVTCSSEILVVCAIRFSMVFYNCFIDSRRMVFVLIISRLASFLFLSDLSNREEDTRPNL